MTDDLYIGDLTCDKLAVETDLLFFSGNKQVYNKKLCDVRNSFDKYNLISGLHSYYSRQNKIYKNILPPLSLLNKNEEKDLMNILKNLNFTTNSPKAA